jgi:hypothetical protein
LDKISLMIVVISKGVFMLNFAEQVWLYFG